MLSSDGSLDITKYQDFQDSKPSPEPKPYLAHIGYGELIATKITDMCKDPRTLVNDIEKMEQLLNDLEKMDKYSGLLRIEADIKKMISRNIYYLRWKINYYKQKSAAPADDPDAAAIELRQAIINYKHLF